MQFKKKAGIATLGVAVLLAICGSAFAKNSGHVSLSQAVNINGTQLAAGEYHVSWQTHSPEATVTFKGKHGAEASAEGKLVERATRYNDDSVVYADNSDGTKTILEIRFAGSKKVLTFGEAAADSAQAAPKHHKIAGSGPQMRPARQIDPHQQIMPGDPYLLESVRQAQTSSTATSGRRAIQQ